MPRPSTPRSKGEREDRQPDNLEARARAWARWNEMPRDASDEMRIVTAMSLWGAPQTSDPFPKRFHASQLGKATLRQDLYDEMLSTPMDMDDPVQILSPRTWADLCLDVWALHSRSGQRPRLMRVWLNKQRALVEIHRGKTVTVDDILPDEVVGFVRGFTRLGPRTGDVDGLRWLSRGSMPIGSRPLWRTYKQLTELGAVAPEGSFLGDALRAADFHVLAMTCMRYDSAWTENCAELRVLDAGGMTYQVGHAYRKETGADRWQPPSDEAMVGEWEPPSGPPLVPAMWDEAGEEQEDRADTAGVARHARGVTSADVAVEEGTAGRPRCELPEGACAPVALTDLPVVPIDPKVVLWAVEKMIEL